MAAYEFIAGYVTLWFGWSSLVAAALTPGQRTLPLGLGSCVSILVCATLPVLLLSFGAYYTHWIPSRIGEMLSLMSPVLLGLFVADYVHRAHKPNGELSE